MASSRGVRYNGTLPSFIRYNGSGWRASQGQGTGNFTSYPADGLLDAVADRKFRSGWGRAMVDVHAQTGLAPLMSKVFLMLATLLLGCSIVINDAEARRLGGGKSLGRKSPSYSQQQAAPAPAAPAQRAAGAGSGSRRWLGPLAGLAAGGLLGALLFGDAFEGFKLLDFLLLMGLAVGGLMVFRALRARRRPAAPGGGHAFVGAHGSNPGFDIPEIGSGIGQGGSASALSRPAWFKEGEFLRAAKSHFIRLQAAWDKADMQDIREYTTPELFAELTLERQQPDEDRFTEVVSLEAELLGLVTEGERLVASVRYSGLVREARDAAPHPFTEVWYVQRPLNDPDADWYVSGIEQA